MLKALLFIPNINILYKIKNVLSSVSVFSEVTISNDKVACLENLKNNYYDFLILEINDLVFRDKLIKTNSEIIQLPVITIGETCSLEMFLNARNIIFKNSEFKNLPFLHLLSELIPENVLQIKRNIIEDYVPIKAIVFRKIIKTPCDLYLKIGNEKYLKIINQSDDSIIDLLDRYEAKKVADFYITKSDFYKYSNELFSNLLPEESTFRKKEDFYLSSQLVIKEMINEIGINENVIKVTGELVESALEEYKDPNLSSLLDKFKYSKERYIYDHSLLTSIFAVALCEKFEWRNQQNMKKMVFASIYHDFAFANPALAIFETNYKENPNLSRENKIEIKNHSEKMVGMLSKNKSISAEVLSLISKHHEAHGDQSYPLGLSSANLSIFECVFLVAHEFANELYKIAFRPDKLSKAINNVLEFSNSGNLKQVRSAFVSIVDEKYLVK